MRVIAGRYKGRRLRCPSQDIRPVMSKMRESIFSMLYSRYGSLEGRRFLDIFCGSAVMSVEAASRGASYVEAVEQDRRKRKILQDNLSILEVPWKLHLADAYDYLLRISIASQPFDIIYLDPPFPMKDKAQLLQSLGQNLLQPSGLVIIHLPKHESKLQTLDNGLFLECDRHYGGSALCLYQFDHQNSSGNK